MRSNETMERQWSPDIDAYRKDYWENRPQWRVKSSLTLRREKAKRRTELEQSMREAERSLRDAALQLQVVRMSAHAKSRRTATKDDNRADISDAAISRVAGGAALGTVIGTMITPGIGTMAGALVGGIAGASVPRILRRRHSEKHNDDEAATRVR